MKRVTATPAVVALVLLSAAASGLAAGPTHHAGELDSSEVWLPSGNPHILDADVYTGDGVTLTITPGCTVLVEAGVELYTGYAHPGSIIAAGKPDSMITFTSASDTVAGFWQEIAFWQNTMSTARMSYCNVLFGGKTSDNRGAVRVEGAGIRFDHNLVRKSGSNGLWVASDGHFSDFCDNTVTGCTRYAVHIGAANVATLGTGNTLVGSARNGIEVDGAFIKKSGTWLNHGVPYVICEDVAIGDASGSPVITLSAGTTLKMMPGCEFYIGYSAPGGLIADGTDGQIAFTSAVASPAPGDWVGLSFYGNSISSQCLVKNCRIEYGGAHHGVLYVSDCLPTITGDSIGHSLHYGIYLAGTEYPDPAELRANNTIYDYVDGDINIPVAVGECPGSQAVGRRPEPTILSGVSSIRHLASRVVFNPMGRRVLNPRSGICVVRELPAVGREPSVATVRKVLIVR